MARPKIAFPEGGFRPGRTRSGNRAKTEKTMNTTAPHEQGSPVPSLHAPGRIGDALGAMLAGCWRGTPAALSLPPAVLEQVATILDVTGTGAIGWWRLRRSGMRNTRLGRLLKETYQVYSAEAARQEAAIQALMPRFRAAGVEPILIKGWTSARLYPETGLRPYSDFDVCVHPRQVESAARVLTAPVGLVPLVDLHEGVPDLPDRSWEEVYGRTRLVPLGGIEIRVLGPDDHLRLLCLHLIRHGGIRPLWLCDVGVALESVDADFDWDYFLSGKSVVAAWAVSALGLAHHLLGAKLPAGPIGARIAWLPFWLLQTVALGVGAWRCGQALAAPGMRHPAPRIRKLESDHCLLSPGPIPWDAGAAAWRSIGCPGNAYHALAHPQRPAQVSDALAPIIRLSPRPPCLTVPTTSTTPPVPWCPHGHGAVSGKKFPGGSVLLDDGPIDTVRREGQRVEADAGCIGQGVGQRRARRG